MYLCGLFIILWFLLSIKFKPLQYLQRQLNLAAEIIAGIFIRKKRYAIEISNKTTVQFPERTAVLKELLENALFDITYCFLSQFAFCPIVEDNQ